MAEGTKKSPKKTRKPLLLLLSIVLILAIAAGGTVAYLVMESGTVANSFQSGFVTSQVNANGNGSFTVTNTGNVDAYIRAAVVVNWMDSHGNVRGIGPTADEYTIGINSDKWTENGGFYYYKDRVGAKQTTEALVTSFELTGTAPAGYDLVVEVVAEAIQADGDLDSDGTPAYQDAWGVTLYGN